MKTILLLIGIATICYYCHIYKGGGMSGLARKKIALNLIIGGKNA